MARSVVAGHSLTTRSECVSLRGLPRLVELALLIFSDFSLNALRHLSGCTSDVLIMVYLAL